MSRVTVILPAYNEGAAFGASLTSLADYVAMHRGGGHEFHYVIVDDGSSDETYAAAVNFARWRRNVRVLRHDKNRGLGAALRTAFAAIETELALVLDSDLSYSAATAIDLVEALEQKGADIVLASAYARGGAVANVPFLRRILSREANRLLSLATGGRYATLTCMVRAYRADAARRLEFRSDGMIAIPEMLLSGVRQHMRIVEVPATLRWSDERVAARRGFNTSRAVSQTASTVALAFRHRPSLWLAVPGLFPGLLPLVVALLLLFRVGAATLALGTTLTIIVQYTSLALFGGQLATFFGRKCYSKRLPSNGAT
jgi:dolichol-phosphate mannosyltransferase